MTFENVGPVFTFVLLIGASFRITRFITTDDLTDFFRRAIDRRFGPSSNWATLVNCNWCTSIYIATAVILEHLYLGVVPLYVHAILTASAVCGYLGIWDD